MITHQQVWSEYCLKTGLELRRKARLKTVLYNGFHLREEGASGGQVGAGLVAQTVLSRSKDKK